jgi:hypothetical protein
VRKRTRNYFLLPAFSYRSLVFHPPRPCTAKDKQAAVFGHGQKLNHYSRARRAKLLSPARKRWEM